MNKIPILHPDNIIFPKISAALTAPNGLLAAGGDLKVDTLISAYSQGIFPWYNKGEPILWWSPSPRLVLYPKNLHISRSLQKLWNKNIYQITIDQQFQQVIKLCSVVREQHGTWITDEIIAAYTNLFVNGYAHSIEVSVNDKLVGGLYGIAIGKIFFGESMFALEPNVSKLALIKLVEILKKNEFELIDCQQDTKHLRSMGALLISRKTFSDLLAKYAVRKNYFPPGV